MNTRQSDEKLRNIALIGKCEHQIVGAKLPSNRQLLQTFFFNMRYVKLDAKDSAGLAIDATIIFWQQARIPIIRRDKIAIKLLTMYDDWKYFQKNDVEKLSAKSVWKKKYDDFIKNLDNLFDIAPKTVFEEIRNEEDIQFLKSQRLDGRPGSMIGIDQKLAAKEERSRQRKEQEEARKLKHAQAQATPSTSTAQEAGEYFELLSQ